MTTFSDQKCLNQYTKQKIVDITNAEIERLRENLIASSKVREHKNAEIKRLKNERDVWQQKTRRWIRNFGDATDKIHEHQKWHKMGKELIDERDEIIHDLTERNRSQSKTINELLDVRNRFNERIHKLESAKRALVKSNDDQYHRISELKSDNEKLRNIIHLFNADLDIEKCLNLASAATVAENKMLRERVEKLFVLNQRNTTVEQIAPLMHPLGVHVAVDPDHQVERQLEFRAVLSQHPEDVTTEVPILFDA